MTAPRGGQIVPYRLAAARAEVMEPRPIDGLQPPHDLPSEAAVLSAILIDPDALAQVRDVLKAEHFFSEAHRRIYEACITLSDAGRRADDVVSVMAELRASKRLSQVGGPGYLTEILNASPDVRKVRVHAEIVFDTWRLRQMALACQRALAEVYQGTEPSRTPELLTETSRAITELAETSGALSQSTALEASKSLMRSLADAAKTRGVPTGIGALDRALLGGGIRRGQLVYIGGRPGMGKSALVAQMAAHAALNGHGVLFVALEMSGEQMIARQIAAYSGVPLTRLYRLAFQGDELSRVNEATARVARLPIRYVDEAGQTVASIRSHVSRAQAAFARDGMKLGAIFVDHVGLVAPERPLSTREQEVSRISKGLHQLGKDTGVPVIACAQLSRVAANGTKVRRPTLTDLRESGSLEQDAEVVLMLHRPAYYDRSLPPDDAEVLLEKQRDGESPRVFSVKVDLSTFRFYELDDTDSGDGGYE